MSEEKRSKFVKIINSRVTFKKNCIGYYVKSIFKKNIFFLDGFNLKNWVNKVQSVYPDVIKVFFYYYIIYILSI